MDVLPSLLSTLTTLDPGLLDQEYSVVRSKTLSLKRDLGLTTEVGALKENIKKNRYKDVLPYDQSRVVLSLLTTDSDSDYINASFIKGVAGAEKRYIASQGPLSLTLTDFWRMIWQHNIKVIVMACREIEMGKKKCECYWAPVHQFAEFGPFTIYSQGETCPTEDIVIRNLMVTYQQDSRSLIQYQFLSWPDHDVPYKASGVLDLLDRVRMSQGTHSSPLLVHCSAGCGRTGVICALDYIHDLLVTKQITSDFSIMEIILEFRRQRPSAVQTKEQYQFIFSAVACLLERMLQRSGQQFYCNLSGEPERTRPAPATRRSSKLIDMNDTYAVVNKPKHPHPPPTAPPTLLERRPAGACPPSHHLYDNDPAGASAAPVYSSVRPRAKPQSLLLSATPIYDTATPANPRLEEEPLSPQSSKDFHLVSAEGLLQTDDDYEEFSSSVTDVASFSSPGGMGFNCRIQKPRGPRDPPNEWSRLER